VADADAVREAPAHTDIAHVQRSLLRRDVRRRTVPDDEFNSSANPISFIDQGGPSRPTRWTTLDA
jgi:hypothetical protein